MKLSATVDSLSNENDHLKKLAILQTVVTMALSGILYTSFDKNPVMVERTERGLELLRPTEFLRSDADLKIAASILLKSRFDTGAVSPEVFLNPKQIELRAREQTDLKNRSLKQNIVIESIDLEKDQVTADVTRVISVGDVRSALKARLRLKFESVTPNPSNPYGLLLSIAEPVEPVKGAK
jgi:hypothetical protein